MRSATINEIKDYAQAVLASGMTAQRELDGIAADKWTIYIGDDEQVKVYPYAKALAYALFNPEGVKATGATGKTVR